MPIFENITKREVSYYLITVKIKTHINIPNIIIYFFNVIFSFNIILDAIIVITIELVLIIEITDTFPSNNANLSKIDDDNYHCIIKYNI